MASYRLSVCVFINSCQSEDKNRAVCDKSFMIFISFQWQLLRLEKKNSNPLNIQVMQVYQCDITFTLVITWKYKEMVFDTNANIYLTDHNIECRLLFS